MNEIDAIHTDITNLTKEINRMKEVSNELRKQNSPLSSLQRRTKNDFIK